jgi:putative transposase
MPSHAGITTNRREDPISSQTCSATSPARQQPMVAAAIRGVFRAEHHDQAREQLAEVVDRLARPAPKVAQLLEHAEPDLLAFYAFPAEHWSKLRSTNPLERVNREIGRRSDVIGIFPNDAALLRLAGALLLEHNDEWLVGRRYLSQESLTALTDQGTPHHQSDEETHNPAQLQAA